MEASDQESQMYVWSSEETSHLMETGDYPKLDELEIMDDEGHPKYQRLMEILVWVVTIWRIDLAHSTSLLS